MGLTLFDGDSSGEENEKLNKIEIDREFARRYEHNKKREDLQRLEELKKKGLIDSDADSASASDESSSSEKEEDEEELSKKKDLEFFDALIRVRNKDPILKNKEAKLFEYDSDSESEEEEEEEEDDDGDSNNNHGNGNNGSEKKGNNKVKKDGKKEEKRKPMYLKDVVSKHLIEEGPEFEDADDNVDRKKVKSYAEEQEELRKAFMKAVEEAEAEEDDDGGQFLREKRKRGGEDEEEDIGIGEKLDEYFGGDEKLDKDMMFLKDYFRNRMWVGDGDDKKGLGDEQGLGVSEDEGEIERQEDYEREYNFRFEENAGDRVMGHSRVVEGSVRKKMNARKSQRERKEERMAQAEFERKEELKHLKNVKKKEMMEKLRKIREAAGVGEDGDWLLDGDDLEEEFNPDEYDKKMKEAFDDGYYKSDDIDPDFGSDRGEDGGEIEKPDFDKEDEMLGLPKNWDDISSSHDGFLSARERILMLKAEIGDNHERAGDEEDDVAPEDGKRKKKRKRRPSEVEKAVRDQLMEEYYKLDYEDTIGDLKTRFKYRTVNTKRYGLSTEEILMMDDKELNQYVSIKKLAPYREKEWKVPRIKTYQQRQMNKEFQGDVLTVTKTHKKKLSNSANLDSVVSSAESEKPRPEESTGVTSNLSRRNNRKHRQAELKLSRPRLMAYGKIPSKPKSKKKSRVQDAV